MSVPEKETIIKLITCAMEQRAHSYVPYSDFRVGAAILCKNGHIYTGCNIENASYPASMCADRVALFKAVSEGERDFSAICIVGGKTGELTDYCTPCGTCRQVFAEFCDPDDFRIIIAVSPKDYKVLSLRELFPWGFGPEDLA